MPNNSVSKYLFRDRADAAQQLIEAMPTERLKQQPVSVIAISEGGTLVAEPIARLLQAPVDVLLSEPIPAPNNPELPIAMISETQTLVQHEALIDAFGIDEDYVYDEAKRIYNDRVLSHVYRYRNGERLIDVRDRIVVLVDECVETGITTMTAIKSMIERGAKNVYLAVPVLDGQTYENLIAVCDGVFCPHRIRDYVSIEYYYQTLEAPDIETIKRIIDTHE
jgi:putative phosphoribosyl transferase